MRPHLVCLGAPQRNRSLLPADLPSPTGAVVMSSWMPDIAMRRFVAATLPDASSFVALLQRAHEQQPPAAP
ncbi:hypothetical protein DIE15_10245 [Burkholderia sp. Bp9031]|uniref:hypothetical protein n=1 Tax=Burkholderia sp. Bp9031 TaxID=2184566 RepID=UPI000F5EB834|nr:hypothetical protein [Burkholderia sp. Bp9031]RQZ17727.1 hypothetical protein DIE15_10245 [Burkholderia sp. Bp9031]